MSAVDMNETVQLFDLLLEFFADGAHWIRGRYRDDHGRHCLIAAVDALRRRHRLASEAAVDFLQQALPRRTLGLVYFNDHCCRDVGELRSVIVKARTLALGEADRERAAAAAERWLLAEIEKERAAKTAVGGDGVVGRAPSGGGRQDADPPLDADAEARLEPTPALGANARDAAGLSHSRDHRPLDLGV
ncbi:MAG TPA: hypothetical protein VJ770_23690 [Stellaceae bacterium]|nr:hypothetical protein [Stellaceae bacterium]